MAEAFASVGATRAAGRIVGQNASGTVVGWVRIEYAGETAAAEDFRLDLRNDGGSWVVANVESRTHCAVELVNDACP